MSTLAMPSPPYQHGFAHGMAWQDVRPEPSSRSRDNNIALPSIRQAFPELQLQIQEEKISPSSSSLFEKGSNSCVAHRDYIHSPTYQKRRRSSIWDGVEVERVHPAPRHSRPGSASHRPPSPSSFLHTAPRSTWTTPVDRRRSPSRTFALSSGPGRIGHVEIHPTLPSMTTLNFGRGSGEDYPQEQLRTPSITSSNSYGTDGGSPAYAPSKFGQDFHHPSRIQSLSVGSAHPFERTRFSPPNYSPTAPYGHHQYHETFMRIRDYSMGMNGEGKQRKRRGNLPKETTDKLRMWFHAHLHHPYPSEEEKQDLMRETGLQLNQISNWFINARRRQLPAMINNARAESDAMTVRGESKLIPSTERSEYDVDNKPLSDSEGSTFQDSEIDSIKRRRVTHVNRGSI
ncbi:uncharacterized protein F4822DRAFT_16468 [Hypoxylon trugodes]|uniref:uncharacterized protein n=1 Tax=Hypoxylon trugodes TaxID=326681 RepID=UPI00219A0F45|nr:uncharacterized protein F4822DRAFT_16468 [Hypoxylon trugodes]KAI1393549.1 hypothetical protein F4822DRAFT_16468 [Hypoxylon trugodes]